MLKNKAIAIISPNILMAVGLRELLNNYFTPREIEIFKSFEDFQLNEPSANFELIFTFPDVFVSHIEEFQTYKNSLVIFSDKNSSHTLNSNPWMLNINQTETELITELEKLLDSILKQSSIENTEELSIREIDVLKLVSLGKMNKQIADQLNISMHTVISHRKNITRKLGIKTVSGLTVYALMNGLISSGDLE